MDPKAHKVCRELKVLKALKEILAFRVRKHLARKVFKEKKVFKDLKDHRVFKVIKVPSEPRETRVIQAIKEAQELKALKVRRAQLVLKEAKGRKVDQERKVHQGLAELMELVHKVLKVYPEIQARTACKVRKEQ